MELPPVLGSVDRERVVILVTGRTAMARMAGLPSVVRQATAVERLGMDPLVVYPPSMRTLGAEMRAVLSEAVQVLAYDEFMQQETGSPMLRETDLVTALTADWYLSFRALADFCTTTSGPAVARFEDRGRVVAPIARLPLRDLKAALPRLSVEPSGAVLSTAAGEAAIGFRCGVKSRHRLSDNIAIARAEAKLFSALQRPGQAPFVQVMHKYLSFGLTQKLARFGIRPLPISVLKLVAGLSSAYALTARSFGILLLGAVGLCLTRALDGAASEVARARIETRTRVERIDFAGDVLVFLVAVIALASRADAGEHARALGFCAVVGIAISAMLSYLLAMKERWRTLDEAGYIGAPASDFASRFTNRGGASYGLLFAVLTGRIDLFLWAAALASHLFYVVLLRVHRRHRSGSGRYT